MPVVAESRFLVPAAAGDVIFDGPIGTTVKAGGNRTNGSLAIMEMPVAPGFMVPPHTHRDVDEWSYVLEGRIGARVGDDEFSAEPGAWILKPRGIMHVFWNAGPEPARIIELATPAGIETFFEDMGRLARAGELTDERMGAMAEAAGMTVSMDWVEDLTTRFNLEVSA